MNTFSHTLIGKIILKHLEEQAGIELDRRGFLYGNVLPDFRRYYKRRPHKTTAWESYLKREIQELTQLKQTGKRFSRGYSKRLGVICHFYSDFFCYAHTQGFKENTYGHMKYEWELDRKFRKNAVRLYQSDLGGIAFPASSAESIYEDFETLQTKYLESGPDFMRDLLFTLRACAGVVKSVAESSVVTQSEPIRLGGLIATAANG